jgi:hypothetical protein
MSETVAPSDEGAPVEPVPPDAAVPASEPIAPETRETVTLAGTDEDVAWLAQTTGYAVEDVTLPMLRRYLAYLEGERQQATLARDKALADRMLAHAYPQRGGQVSEEDAAALILSKCQPEVVEAFGLAREAVAGLTDATILAALLTKICEQQEQLSGHYEAVSQHRISLPATGGPRQTLSPGAVRAGGAPLPGREQRDCPTCQVAFTPQRQGQTYGCQACGDYPNYLRKVAYDNQEYKTGQQAVSFEAWTFQHQMPCTCAGQPVVVAAATVAPRPILPLQMTHPRVVTNAQGEQMIVHEPVSA